MDIYLVGGAVRDALLGIEVKDRDWVVVGAAPDDLINQGYQQVGADFPVFLHPKTHEEYALARTERKSGQGYHGFEVCFDDSVSLVDDLKRRDLTINAIAQHEHGELIDPYHGQADLNAKVLRHVSSAFREDPLRVLRTARFAARFYNHGFRVADETMTLMRDMAQSGELAHLVHERVWQETERALSEPKPSEYFNVLKRAGALCCIFPELDALFGVPQTQRWHPEVDTGIHTLKALDVARSNTNDTTVLMATLCHDLGKGLTPKDKLPSHHGHEQIGADLIKTLGPRYRWPVAVTQLAEKVAHFHTHCHGIANLKPSTLLNMLKQLDAFRDEHVVKRFGLCCTADYQGRSGFEDKPYPQAGWLQQARDSAAAINAKPFVQQGLKGAEIGSAMDTARINALKALKESWKI